MKLLLDEMLSGEIAAQLNRRKIDTVAVQEQEELRQLEDPAVFAAAQEQQRAVVTYSLGDFMAIFNDYAQHQQEHHGLVLLNSSRFPQRQPATIGQIIIGLVLLAKTDPGPSFLHWLQ